jgi:hypothetical protein
MTYDQIDKLRQQHAWLVDPLQEAVSHLDDCPFFQWVRRIRQPKEFRPAGLQLFHHSATLPKAIGLMLGATPISRGNLYHPYALHAHEEADHHLMLLRWLLKYDVATTPEEVYSYPISLQTRNCINVAYELAIHADHNGWMACINSAIELCFYKFFAVTSVQMHSISAGDHYFDVHVESDAEHSIIGLRHLVDLTDTEKVRLRRKAIDSVSLWYSMVHSWINLSIDLHLSDNGEKAS